MGLDLGALGLAAGRAVTGYGAGRLAGEAATAAQAERDQQRREAYAQRLHEIMLAHALSGRGSGTQALSDYSPELAQTVHQLVPDLDLDRVPVAQAMQIALAKTGEAATAGRQSVGERFSSGETASRVARVEHDAVRSRAQRYAEGYASQHADEVKANAGAVMGRIYTLLSSFYPQLTAQERYEVAGSAIETFRQPRAKTFNELMGEELSRSDSSGYVPQGTVTPGTTSP